MKEKTILYCNGRIYTCDEAQINAEAMIVRGQRILWVGSDAEASAVASDEEKVVLDGDILTEDIDHIHVDATYINGDLVYTR